MINLDDLWVGDWLLIKSKKLKGTFEGLEDGYALVKVNEKFYKVNDDNLEITEAPIVKEKYIALSDNTKVVINQEPENIAVDKSNALNTIDLHIERLAPDFQFNFDELSFQVRTCDTFIKKSINLGLDVITIIHGKGKGVLKNEIEKLLEKYHEYVSVKTSVNQGGAIEVWLKKVKNDFN